MTTPTTEQNQPALKWYQQIWNWIEKHVILTSSTTVLLIFFYPIVNFIFNQIKYQVIEVKIIPSPNYYRGDCTEKEDIDIAAIVIGKGLDAHIRYYYQSVQGGKILSPIDSMALTDTTRLNHYHYDTGSDEQIVLRYDIIHKNAFTNLFRQFKINLQDDNSKISKTKYKYECVNLELNQTFVRGGKIDKDSISDLIVLENEVNILEYEQYAHKKGLIAPMLDLFPNLEKDTDKEQYPITGITWEQAQNYCKHIGMRLPTVPEFRYMVKGGLKQNTQNAVSPQTSSIDKIILVESNAINLKNINGNAAEWCNDDLGTDKKSKAVMGGMTIGFKHNEEAKPYFKDKTYKDVGFRCVSNPK